jgi:hypothetical protein
MRQRNKELEQSATPKQAMKGNIGWQQTSENERFEDPQSVYARRNRRYTDIRILIHPLHLLVYVQNPSTVLQHVVTLTKACKILVTEQAG